MNIYEAITKIMSEGYSIGKDKKNPQQGYKYRGIDDVMNVFQPLLAKYKVFVVPEVIGQEREERTTKSGSLLIYSICTMKYTFYAEDGTHVEAIVIGEGMDSGDKSTNKAMSVAMKYAMFQVFCIPTEEMHDSEEESPEPVERTVTKEEIANLNSLCEKFGKTIDGILEGLRKKGTDIKRVEDMKLSDYQKAINRFKKLSEEKNESKAN